MIVEKSVEAKISPVEVKVDLEAPMEDGFKVKYLLNFFPCI